MGKGLFVLFLVFPRWFWFPSSVPPCWQSSLPQGFALCCGACVLGFFFVGVSFCWPLLACRDPTLLFCSLLFVLCGRVFSPSKKVFPCLEFHCIFWTLLRFMLQLRKGHMVQGKLASAGAVHCLHNRDTQTLGH